MPRFEVVRSVVTDEVAIIEADDEEDAERKAWDVSAGSRPYTERIEVTEVTQIRGDDDV